MRFGRYEVVERVGEGGAGTVYRAHAAGRIYAIKVLRGSEEAALRRFERERSLLARLGEAEGFVPLVDAGLAPEGPWLAMPFVGGGTLRDRLSRLGKLTAQETADLMIPLARATGRAHALGVVHRDLKPANILFTEEGKPLIVDLGLAKHFLSEEVPGPYGLSRTGEFRGTVGYAAPEQMLDAKAATPAADVFALGAIMFECITGEPVMQGASKLEVARSAVEGRTKPLGLLRPHAPRWLRRIVARALDRSPGRRPRDGEALARALEARQSGAPVAAIAGIVLAVALAVALIVLLVPRLLAPGPAALAREALARAEKHLAAEDDAAALEELDQALALDEALLRARIERARLHARRHDGIAATADADRAVALDARSVEAWCALGAAREERHERPAAVVAWSKALELDPRCALAWAGRAISRSLLEERASMEDADKAVALAPRLLEARLARSLRRLAAQNFRGAREDAKVAVEVAPRSPRAHALHGTSRAWTGDVAGVDEASQAIDLDDKDAWTWCARGFAWIVRERPDAAIADFGRALELDPLHYPALVMRSRVRHMSGDVKGALEDTGRAIAIAPRAARGWTAQADAHVSARDIDAADRDITRAIEVDPTYPPARIVKSLIAMSRRDVDAALAECDEAIRLDPDHSPGWVGRANIQLMRKDFEGAHRAALKAVEVARDALRERTARAILEEVERVRALEAGGPPPR